jgi:predicted aldo/keto reductase-like oxidoreductase
MQDRSSRRNFLAAGLALPAAAAGSRPASPDPQPPPQLLPDAGAGLKLRPLGNTGLKVTNLAFGCMITSDASVIERAADIGINYFDTARGYQGGNNERMVGAALKGKRNRIVLSSKSGARDKASALADLDKSLSELATDHLDIWYLHAKSRPDQITDDLIDAQQTAKKAGKVRFAGVSTHGGQAGLVPWLEKNPLMDVILTSYNFTMDRGMDALLESAHRAGKGIVGMKVMAGGFRRAKPGSSLYDTLKRDGAMVAALKWVLRNPNIDTTIPSMTDMDQLDDNLKAASTPFSAGDEKLLAQQLRHIAPLYCRMCGECEGTCRYGLPVADVLRYLTYAEGYGQFALAREQYLAMPAEQAQARCSLCPSCEVRCPYGVKVAHRMALAQELFA